MELRFVSQSEEATLGLGEMLGRLLPAGSVMTLDGDLGTGKTTLVRGLGAGLGLEDGVSSPTYTLMQAHEGGRLPLFHFDAWMEGREKALLADGADEFLAGDGIAVVEWGSRVVDWLPLPRLEVVLGHRTPEERTVLLRVMAASGATETPAATALLGAFRGVFEALGRRGAVRGLVRTESRESAEPEGAPGVD